MSIIGTTARNLHFFHRSGPMPCPYLDGRVERKLFTRLPAQPDQARRLNADLSKAGFRRSHDIVYRPVCPGCTACVPVRIPVDRFRPNRSMRRNWIENQDLVLNESPPRAGVEDFALFHRYQAARHAESDMARMSESDYAAMIEEGSASAQMVTLREPDTSSRAGRLLAAVLIDRLDDGFSAVYSYYDLAETSARRGLGIFTILALIELARHHRLAYLYLGYWIGESEKMAYKSRFRPLEQLTSNGWTELDEESGR